MNEENIIEEKLNSPLIVHKETDASYVSNASSVEMNLTHDEEDDLPTLERHRFKKNKSKTKPFIVVICIIALCVAFGYLYANNMLPFNQKLTTEVVSEDVSSTTSLQQKYYGTIVVKNTYIFVDGNEVDGIKGLIDAIKYEDKSTTRFIIIDENANSTFLNDNVLETLRSSGFYGDDTVIKHVVSTGLIANDETTTTTTTTIKKTTIKSTTLKNSSSEKN